MCSKPLGHLVSGRIQYFGVIVVLEVSVFSFLYPFLLFRRHGLDMVACGAMKEAVVTVDHETRLVQAVGHTDRLVRE